MIEPDYKLATNAAYELLTGYYGKLPVIDVFSILDLIPGGVKTKLYTYTDYAEKMRCTYREFFRKYASSEHGFTIPNFNDNKYIICYNERKDEKTIRFTIAHEIGHIVLGHRVDNAITDREANCFARNLLCPIQISDSFGVETEQEYVNCFNISEPMAIATIANRKSDKYYISQDNYDKVNGNVFCYFAGYTLKSLYGYV